MSKKLIIAEKPSVANDVARALGGFTRHGDYYESTDYVLSSAIGLVAAAAIWLAFFPPALYRRRFLPAARA